MVVVLIATGAISTKANAPLISDFEGETMQTPTPQEKLAVGPINASSDDIKLVLAANIAKYGGNYALLIEVLKCESSLMHDGIYGDSGLAYGVAQFHKKTFDGFCEGDYHDYKDQIKCFVKMIADGLGSHWTCWSKLK